MFVLRLQVSVFHARLQRSLDAVNNTLRNFTDRCKHVIDEATDPLQMSVTSLSVPRRTRCYRVARFRCSAGTRRRAMEEETRAVGCVRSARAVGNVCSRRSCLEQTYKTFSPWNPRLGRRVRQTRRMGGPTPGNRHAGFFGRMCVESNGPQRVSTPTFTPRVYPTPSWRRSTPRASPASASGRLGPTEMNRLGD